MYLENCKNKLWITSDLHFCHDKEFIWGPRGFKSVKEMNTAIVENWNSVVDKEDHVIVLGDLMLNNNEKGLYLLKQLKGTLHLIRGNHDTDARVQEYIKCYNVWERIVPYADTIQYNGYNFYLSHYPTLTSNHDKNKPLNKQIINLCGHLHTDDAMIDMEKGLVYHCELDAHGNTPVLIDDIIEDIKVYRGMKALNNAFVF